MESTVQFNSLDSEIDYLKNNLKDDELNMVKNTNNSQTITMNLLKSIQLRIVTSQEYPNESPISIKLYSFDLASLKPMRQQIITDFIHNTTCELNSVLYNQKCCYIVDLYNKTKNCLSNATNQEFLSQTLDILEASAVKYHTFNIEPIQTAHNSVKNVETKTKKPVNEPETATKSKFKGSEYIFDRIKWDQSIDKDQIIIGYLDRFKGVCEIKFNDFKGVHEDRDGIPQHRIRHFKINDTTIWDRDNKIDIITGGDYEKYFNQKDIQIDALIEPVHFNPNANVINKGNILKYNSDNWAAQEHEKNPKPNFIDTLKLISYNIMSKNNFKRSVNETMKKAKHSAGLEPLIHIERMNKIIELFKTNQPDFILLQECETYEESKLKADEYIQKNYYMSTDDSESSCVILSRQKPVWVKTLKLCDNSMKVALIAKFQLRTNSLKRIEELIIANIHLTSGKANNFFEKRKNQLETLKKYFVDNANELEFKADYLLIGGDFNFGEEEENKSENNLLKDLFISNGFIDLITNVMTFDPTVNYSAAISSAKLYPRRLDRLLFKSNDVSKFELVNSGIVNKSPFEIKMQPYHHISFEPYLNILTENDKFYLHPSDHYGLVCSIKFKANLHYSNLSHQSTIAVVVPKHVSELIQEIRAEHDSQINRWPPHINFLYPFYLNIDLNVDKEENHLIGDILSCLTQFKPFKCNLNEMKTFDKNNVVYLEPCESSQLIMKSIYKSLKNVFEDSMNKKWRDILTPHLTIAQPIDKRKAHKNWTTNKYDLIKEKFNRIDCTFTVDCLYWMTRTNDTPFEVKYTLPLGARYPNTIIGLNPKDLYSNESNILKFLFDNKMILSEVDERELTESNSIILNEINSITNFKVLTLGSYSFGIKCNDFDFCILKTDLNSDMETFKKSLTYNLAQNNALFHIVRNIPDANIPIIELCLNMKQIANSDIQIYSLTDNNIDEYLYDSFDYMNSIGRNTNEYNKIFPISGIFENNNIKKFIKNYKDFQILLTFVKYWAQKRQIYGKAFGYIGGISWAIMIAVFLRQIDKFNHTLEIDNNAKRFESLVFEFFRFYSTKKDFYKHEPIFLLSVDKILNDEKFKHERTALTILQSVYPYHNSSKNVNESNRTVIFSEIDRAKQLLEKNNSYEFLCSRIDISEFIEKIQFRIEVKLENNLGHVFTLVKAKTQSLINNLQRVYNGQKIRAFTELYESKSGNKTKYGNDPIYYYIGISKEEIILNEISRQLVADYCNNFIKDIKSIAHTSEFEIILENYKI